MCFPCVCLSVPCALLLLSVSPPLTCSQSPGLCVCHWVHLCPVNSPCLVHLCPCLPRLDCSHLSLVICCLCVYIVLVFSLRLRKLLLYGMFLVFSPLFLVF